MAKKKHRGAPHNKPEKQSSGGYRNLVLNVFAKNQGATLTHKQLCYLLSAKTPNERQHVFDALMALVEKRQLNQLNHHSFTLPIQTPEEGVLEMNAKGFGFVRIDGSSNDVMIREENKGIAMDGDRVQITIIKDRNGKREGLILNVLERARMQLVGTIKIRNQKAILYPDSAKFGVPVEIPESKLNGAQQGMRTVVKITVWPEQRKMPYGEVVALLGYAGTNDAEMISILINQGFDPFFPEEVLREASLISTEITAQEIAKRLDLRSITTFTIDPVDAKDFDDALSIERLENGNLKIGVHIADVGHYIQEGSALDKEALKRSNSVYLVDRVMPMLPEQLSNVLCSLRPHEDKLAFSAVFEFNDAHEVVSSWYGKTVIHSNRRYTYEEVQGIIEGSEEQYAEEVHTFNKIAKALRASRFKKGALNIISEELRFVLSENGAPTGTVLKTSKESHQLIEEFMLLANRSIAAYLSPKKEKAETHHTIYRVHDLPDLEKLGLLTLFCEKFGLELNIDQIQEAALNLNKLLEEIENEPFFSLIQGMVVRSMAKAVYSTNNKGHFGLAFKEYTHFTSPIRRYADLIVHRQLFEKTQTGSIKSSINLEEICKRISSNERKAIEAERESVKYFQTLMLIDHIGETFEGIISGISEYGIFVRLTTNHCEGMVSIQSITSDRYFFDPDRYAVVGKRSGNTLNLGDVVSVQVDEVSPRKRQIDFVLKSA
ncbi:MAG: ribonuclease R [Flavobacteriales bacterium]